MSADGVAFVRAGKAPGPHREKRLSARFVKTAPPGRHTDGGGLYLVVGPSGARRWLLRLVIRGHRRDLGLGSASLFSLAEAREKAHEFRRIARAGGDPMARDEHDLPRSMTFKAAAAEVHRTRIKRTSRNGKHVDQWLTTLKTYAFPTIGAKRVYDITPADILRVLEPIWLEKEETARRVLQRMKMILDWALVKGLRVDPNPVSVVRMGLLRQKKEVEHFAALPWVEAPDLRAKLKASEGVAALALRFTLASALRSGTVRKARWKEFDRSEWHIPGEHMKSGKPFVVPISWEMFELLNEARRWWRGPDSLVFPSPTKPDRPLSENAMAKALQRHYPDATVHGLRSTFRDWAEENTPVPREVKEAAMAHAKGDKVEAAYLRYDYRRQRALLMDAWGFWLRNHYIPASWPDFAADQEKFLIGELTEDAFKLK